MVFGVVVLAALAALVLFIAFGGPTLPADTDRMVDEVSRADLSHVVAGTTGMADSNGVRIWYESIDPEATPKGTVLLCLSMGGNALYWPPSYIRAFLDAEYSVIRYDHRDAGMSDRIVEWDRKNPYSLIEMAADGVAVLDALEVGKAHVVGLSLGGMVAQEIAVACPDRVASLTLMSTSGDATDPDLPGLSTRYLLGSAFKGLPLLKYRLLGGERNRVKEIIAKMSSVVGPDELDMREMAEVVLYDLRERRGVNMNAVLRHQAAVAATRGRHALLGSLSVPTLVIHGTDDRMLPFDHGKKLADSIPTAERIFLDGVGHVFPYPGMSSVTERIISFIDRATEPDTGA
ncbi:MAG: alpha/beta hydrolase [Spirochaetaceae bacterium]|nr:MAG: alpha/beta hydrolase [Spirochaetaceae bacterium]